jgi:hypothetical protein
MGHQEVSMPQIRPGGAVSQPNRATQSRLGLGPPMSSIFAWFSSSWPKTKYKGSPRHSRKEAEEKHEKHKTDVVASRRRKIEGGTAARIASGHLSSFSNASYLLSTMRGSSSPTELWVCGGNLVQSLYVLSLLKSIWCALHDYGTIYVIPMVDIVLWDDIYDASTFMLRLYGLLYFGITPMIHVMNLSMHNVLSIMSWGAWHHQV